MSQKRITRRAFRNYVGMDGLEVRGSELIRVGNYPQEIFSTKESVVGRILSIEPSRRLKFGFQVINQCEVGHGDLLLLGFEKGGTIRDFVAVCLSRSSALREV